MKRCDGDISRQSSSPLSISSTCFSSDTDLHWGRRFSTSYNIWLPLEILMMQIPSSLGLAFIFPHRNSFSVFHFHKTSASFRIQMVCAHYYQEHFLSGTRCRLEFPKWKDNGSGGNRGAELTATPSTSTCQLDGYSLYSTSSVFSARDGPANPSTA